MEPMSLKAMPTDQRLILASASPRRRELLGQIGIVPDEIVSSDIDETQLKDETPAQLTQRLAFQKAQHIADAYTKPAFVLGADTVVCVGLRVLPKAEDMATVRECLGLLSGRNHRVITAVCLITPQGGALQRTVETRLKFKSLSHDEIEAYVQSGEGIGKAGGYGIQGLAGAFVSGLIGSYTAVVGLPLFETRNLLIGSGYLK